MNDVLDTCTSDYDPSEAWTLVRGSQATQAPVQRAVQGRLL
ncbi:MULTISPECIES: hypothetical protein [Streptomyces]|nr:hypothetical protein [Streptomyces kasugaensis]